MYGRLIHCFFYFQIRCMRASRSLRLLWNALLRPSKRAAIGPTCRFASAAREYGTWRSANCVVQRWTTRWIPFAGWRAPFMPRQTPPWCRSPVKSCYKSSPRPKLTMKRTAKRKSNTCEKRYWPWFSFSIIFIFLSKWKERFYRTWSRKKTFFIYLI